MKRIITLLAVFVLVTYLFWGCESVTESVPVTSTEILQKTHIIEFPGNLDEDILASVTESGSPTFTDTLPNSTIIEVYGSDINNEVITVAFDYTVFGGTPVDRILQISQSLEYLIIYDVSGVPLSGYVFTGEIADGYEVTLFSGENSIGIAHNEPIDPAVTIEVLYNGQFSQAIFADEDEFDAAMTLYQSVYDQGYDRELLIPAEMELLERAESISIWTDIDPLRQSDIETATSIAVDEDFQDFSDARYSPDQPDNEMPVWLKKFCQFVRIVKKICDIIGDNIVCKYVNVLVLLCDAAEAIL